MPQTPLLQSPPKVEGPIQKAYKPGDEKDLPTRIMDFARGFIGTRPGLTDMNSRTATAAGDAFGQLNPLHMLGPMVGMTKFLKTGIPVTKEGLDLANTIQIPDVARRVGMTNLNLQRLKDYLATTKTHAGDIEKTLAIANKYPRTLAHAENISSFDRRPIARLIMPDASGAMIPAKESGLGEILLDSNQTLEYGRAYPQAETFAHELQHLGQNIKEKDFGRNYSQETLNKGYIDNKYEIAARRGGKLRAQFTPITNTEIPELPKEPTFGQVGIDMAKNFAKEFIKGFIPFNRKPTLSEAFSKSPLALKKYYDELKASSKPIDIRQQLKDTLKLLRSEQKK